MTPPTDASPQPGKLRRRWFTGLAALGGASLLGACAQGTGWGRRAHDDPSAMAHRMEERIERLVKYVGGTPQQKDRLIAIASAAMNELRPLREQLRGARRRGMELLAAPVIDRPALEQLRAAQIQTADAASRRMVQAMADAAEVLTPEQRAKAGERIRERFGRRRRG